jgi:hypothetical protein
MWDVGCGVCGGIRAFSSAYSSTVPKLPNKLMLKVS